MFIQLKYQTIKVSISQLSFYSLSEQSNISRTFCEIVQKIFQRWNVDLKESAVKIPKDSLWIVSANILELIAESKAD